MKCQVPETKRQSSGISMKPDRYGQHNLTVKHLLFSKNANFSFTMSIITIDNALRGNKESILSSKKYLQINRLKIKGKVKILRTILLL